MEENMKKLIAAFSLTALPFAFAACEVEQTEPAVAPDVQVEPGSLPEYDVEAQDVDVETRERAAEVTVPDVDVKVDEQQRTITWPDVDVNVGEDGEQR